jgi:PPM family protein phosphatase
MQLVTHHVTSRGGRRANEDALKVVTGQELALLALADGVGGHAGGGLAAHRCVETIAAGFTRSPGLSDDALQSVVQEADRAVAAVRLENRKPANSMRTTLAFLAICGNSARWAHVGDSRVYWYRDRILMQRTSDHSVAEFVRRLPEGSPVAPPDEGDRHRLLRALGAGEGCNAELGGTVVTLQAGDAFLLCSDGFWSLVPDADITACLSEAATSADWCVALEQRLKEHVICDRPKEQDNYSMIAGMVMS